MKGPDPLRGTSTHPLITNATMNYAEFVRYAQQLHGELPKNSVAVITADASSAVRTISSFPVNMLVGKRGAALLSALGKRGGGGQVILVGDIGDVFRQYDKIRVAAPTGLISDVIRSTRTAAP